MRIITARMRLAEPMYEAHAFAYPNEPAENRGREVAAQGTQRLIVLASLDQLSAERPDVHFFNELPIRYRKPRTRERIEVVPDTMVVLGEAPLEVTNEYEMKEKTPPPLLVIDSISKYTDRKDYPENIDRYEKHLRVRYYLTVDVERREATLFRLRTKGGYLEIPIRPDQRVKLPELELKVGMLDGWLRLWFRDDLLRRPRELLNELNREKQRADALELRLRELERARKNGGH